MKNKLILSSITFMTTILAFAESKTGLFVEPMITFERGEGSINIKWH